MPGWYLRSTGTAHHESGSGCNYRRLDRLGRIDCRPLPDDHEFPRCGMCLRALEQQASPRRERRRNPNSNYKGRTGWPDLRPVVVWIYTLLDPRTMQVRYVGRTDNLVNRMSTHLAMPTVAVGRWVRELAELKLRPIMMPLWAVDPGEDSLIAERVWYRHFRDRQVPLLNKWPP
jgi:hypothetical protein